MDGDDDNDEEGRQGAKNSLLSLPSAPLSPGRHGVTPPIVLAQKVVDPHLLVFTAVLDLQRRELGLIRKSHLKFLSSLLQQRLLTVSSLNPTGRILWECCSNFKPPRINDERSQPQSHWAGRRIHSKTQDSSPFLAPTFHACEKRKRLRED